MNKEDLKIVYENCLGLKEDLIKCLRQTGKSKNSLSFKDKSSLRDYFKIGEEFKDEMRDKRITTIHSSALLAFLAFYKVSEKFHINIDGVDYTKRFFEVKNKCIRTPSQVDVTLVSSDWENVLYLESKFTETLEASFETKDISGAYRWKNKFGVKIYDKDSFTKHTGLMLKGNKDKPFKIAVRGDESDTYLEGIKQMISHYIGMLRGSNGKNKKDFEDNIRKAKKINLASIVYEFPNIPNFEENGDSLSFEKRLENYGNLYEKLAEYLNSLTGQLKDPTKDINYYVRKNLLTYQEVFSNKKNSELLSETVKDLYNIGI